MPHSHPPFSLASHRPYLVGLAGGSCSGKSSLARCLVEGGPDGAALLVGHDCYYRDRSHMTPEERAKINFDEPAALDNVALAKHLLTLKNGESVQAPGYDFATHARLPTTELLVPRPLVIVEGVLLLAVPALCRILDLRVFVDAPESVRLKRRLERDTRQRGRDAASVESQFFATVQPMHERYVTPSRDHADLVLSGQEELTNLSTVLRARIAERTINVCQTCGPPHHPAPAR